MSHRHTTSKPCTGTTVRKTCLQRLADGWIDHTDLCPACTGRFMAALESVSAEPLTWHPNFVKRSGGEVR